MYKNMYFYILVFSINSICSSNDLYGDSSDDLRFLPITYFNRVVSVDAKVHFTNNLDSRMAMITGERNVINQVYMFFVKDTLYIHFQKMNMSIYNNTPINIYLPWASQEGIALGGNADYFFEEDIAQSNVSLELFGNASCHANVNVGKLNLTMRHNSKADLRGCAEKQNFNLADTASCNASQLTGTVKYITKEKTAKLNK